MLISEWHFMEDAEVLWIIKRSESLLSTRNVPYLYHMCLSNKKVTQLSIPCVLIAERIKYLCPWLFLGSKDPEVVHRQYSGYDWPWFIVEDYSKLVSGPQNWSLSAGSWVRCEHSIMQPSSQKYKTRTQN